MEELGPTNGLGFELSQYNEIISSGIFWESSKPQPLVGSSFLMIWTGDTHRFDDLDVWMEMLEDYHENGRII
jgi:hypothetical protein